MKKVSLLLYYEKLLLIKFAPAVRSYKDFSTYFRWKQSTSHHLISVNVEAEFHNLGTSFYHGKESKQKQG